MKIKNLITTLILTIILLMTTSLSLFAGATARCNDVIIKSFSANPTTIIRGDKTVLSWEVEGATKVEIEGINFGRLNLKGEIELAPYATTNYILKAYNNNGGQVTCSVQVTVVDAPTPEINLFKAEPAVIKIGESTTLHWDVVNAKSVSIRGVNARTLPFKGTQIITPTETTTYTLNAIANDGKVVSRTVTVNVDDNANTPIIDYFKADPTEIKDGETTTLSWKVRNATEIKIKGQELIKGVLPLEGSKEVWPLRTTIYTLYAYGATGEVVTLTVTVNVEQPRAEINSFTAEPEEINYGESSTLSWDVSKASKVEIELSSDDKRVVEANDSLVVEPKETTTYVIYAYNEAGDVEKAVRTVVVNIPKPVIEYFTVDREVINYGETAELSWKVTDAVDVKIKGEVIKGVGTEGRNEVWPTATTEYTLEATGIDGTVVKQTIKVTVITEPIIKNFYSDEEEIESGDLVTLFWETINVERVEIVADGHTLRRPANGGISVTPNKTTVYRLIAYDKDGKTTEKELTIVVK